MGPASVENDPQHTIDTSPLHCMGTWSWMAAQLIMAGTGQPMVHDATHDLESFFYVLISICILLNEPYKPKCNSDLVQCFNKYFNTFKPSVLKTITIQSDLTWKLFILQHISDYFKPIISLLTHLHNTIILPLSADGHGNVGCKTPFTHDMFIATIIQTLSALGPDAWMAVSQAGNDDEVGLEMEIGGENSLKLVDVESEVDASPDGSADESLNGGTSFYSLDSCLALGGHAHQECRNGLDSLEVPNKHWHSSLCGDSPTSSLPIHGASVLCNQRGYSTGSMPQWAMCHSTCCLHIAYEELISFLMRNLCLWMTQSLTNLGALHMLEEVMAGSFSCSIILRAFKLQGTSMQNELVNPMALATQRMSRRVKFHSPVSQGSSVLPSTIAKSHMIFAKNTGGGLDPGEDNLVIDDVSLSKDDHCAKAVVHGKSAEIMVTAANLARTIPNPVHCGFKVTMGPQIHGKKSKTSCHISHSEGDALDSLEGPINETTLSFAEAAPIPLPVTSVASGIVPNSNSDPSHLQFYTPPIHDTIKHAKQISHCDIASINSFPLHADFSHKAPKYVNEAIAECHSQGLAIPDGWWPQYLPDITKLLLEDHGNWHSALKKKAHIFVCDHYKWDPQNCCPINAELAKSLLEHGEFLRHRVDIEIKVALDEMVVEGKEVTFKHDIYADVYIDLLGLMAKCDTVPVHCAKTKALHVEWASIRM
ncbi:hypothetical protein EDC04DRAFT_2604353 [Pisolithus marmoratus]|nr:hypothetical protein EDC04DRAFT_2604353 [Pisolithus marmoratus]